MDFSRSLQDQFAPRLTCFGCGPANEKGLQIKSFVQGDRVVCHFTPQPHHRAFGDESGAGMINGGIIGALLDCHLCWTGAYHLMVRRGLETPPCCVTAKYSVTFEQPTPVGKELILEAWVTGSSDRKAVVEGTLGTGDLITARGDGTFVSVKEGHPAYHRWGEA